MISCAIQGQGEQKINGLSFVASPREFPNDEFEHIRLVCPNYLALMPYAFMPSLTLPALNFNHERQWWGERADGCKESIKRCKKENYKIMLKPQIWIGGGEFTGFIDMKSTQEWTELESNYRKFILKFAEIAEEEEVEIFCIGTELGRWVEARPKFWKQLIIDIRKLYGGKLTYAENWDCYDKPTFLPELDFIGVDAYFPLAEGKNPSDDEIRLGWKSHLKKLEECSKKNNKPILFAECGYRSIDFSADKPWDYSNTGKEVNEDLQARLLKIMFEETWDKSWMAGGFIWKWFPNHERSGGKDDNQFTPQNKKGQKVIAEFFGRK
jgi:hypothetical protein